MEEKKNELWTGGSWEHPEEPFPVIPAVVIPEPPRKSRRQKREKRNRGRKIPWFRALLLVMLGAVLALGAVRWALYSQMGDDSPGEHYVNSSTEPPALKRAPTGTGLTLMLEEERGTPLTFSQLYEQVSPSIVSVEVFGVDFAGGGTGVVLSQDGVILTNAHVVAGAEEVVVVLSDNSSQPAQLVGFQNDEDLAVLKIDAEGLTPARFGDSNDLRPGDPVAALGDPLGYRTTITGGVVSGVDRSVDSERGEMLMIQTDAAVNHGNSGGALVNRYGQVVGINTIKIVSGDGSSEAMGFAIPSRRVKYVADRLIAGEPVEMAVFGFTVLTIPEEEGGLELLSVLEESDCWNKGLRKGDVVTAINGRPVNSAQDLAAVKLDLSPGTVIALTYRRDGVEKTVDVALIARPRPETP